jgi:DnaJ-class molecular chaperone
MSSDPIRARSPDSAQHCDQLQPEDRATVAMESTGGERARCTHCDGGQGVLTLLKRPNYWLSSRACPNCRGTGVEGA